MHQEQRNRTTELLKENDIDRALFANYFTVKWLTGFSPAVQLGQNFFVGGPPVVWYEQGHYTLFIVDVQAGFAAGLQDDPDITVETYLGYTIEAPITSGAHLSTVLSKALQESGPVGAIGVESQDMTHLLMQIVNNTCGENAQLTAIDNWLEPLRMIKTDEELAKLRENFRLTDHAHAVCRETVAVGLREIDVWAAAHGAVERMAGERVPFGNDCVVGYREPNNIGGWPLDYEIRPGDSITIDLSTVKYGYWSDSCATYYATEPNEKQKKMHQTATEALDLAISLVRPGAVCKEIDQKVRQFIADAGYPLYPHHTGHAVGVSGHERPRIVPYSDEVIQAGMVILVEPGIYFPGETNVRLEDAMLVQDDGVELLTKHDKSMP